jgi:hypothetical protein
MAQLPAKPLKLGIFQMSRFQVIFGAALAKIRNFREKLRARCEMRRIPAHKKQMARETLCAILFAHKEIQI